MKNKFLLLFLAAILTVFSSCDKELTLFPQDAIAVDEGYQNLNDFNQAVKGLYTGFRRSGYYGATSSAASIYFIPDVMSDDVVINSNGRRSRETFYDWRFDEDSSSETFWLSAYKIIQRANLILDKISAIDGVDGQDNVRGEALAARAIAHFDLAKFYANSPAQGSDSDLGIPYVVSTDSSLEPSRGSLGETYTNILNDMNEAISLINEDNGRGRLNRDVVNALLSRVHMFRGDFVNALIAGENVVGSEVSRDDFAGIWKDTKETSVLWKIIVTEPNDVNIGVSWMQESPDGIRSEYNVDFALFQLYSDNDIRKSVYFETSAFSEVSYNHIVKYRGRLVGNANEVDAKVIRYSEVLLNNAEASAELNQDGKALGFLDELRSNRYEGFVSGNEAGQVLKDAIALERRLELAFEGNRFFDLKRKGLGIERSNFGDQADGTGISAEFLSMPAGDHRFNMAIGDNERNANSNMEQNPGY